MHSMVNDHKARHTARMPFLSRLSFTSSSWFEQMASPEDTVRKKTLSWLVIFFAYFITAQIGVYLYRDIGTSPALIWPPVGIALAAVLLEGYWISTAIALAAFLNAL